MNKRVSTNSWIPLWVDKWLFGSTAFELTLEEQAIWIKLLCLAAKDDGFLRANSSKSYPIEALSGLIFVKKSKLLRALEKFERLNKIERYENGIIRIKNWEKFQLSKRHIRRLTELSEKEKTDIVSAKEDIMSQKTDIVSAKEDIRKENKRKENKRKEKKINIYIARNIFNHWNEKKIIVHKDFEKFKSVITGALSHYTEEEIKEAIDNYAEVLRSDDHFFSYRWTLYEFLTRKNGIDKFLSVNKPLENFKKDEAKEENWFERIKEYARREDEKKSG